MLSQVWQICRPPPHANHLAKLLAIGVSCPPLSVCATQCCKLGLFRMFWTLQFSAMHISRKVCWQLQPYALELFYFRNPTETCFSGQWDCNQDFKKASLAAVRGIFAKWLLSVLPGCCIGLSQNICLQTIEPPSPRKAVSVISLEII